MRQSNAHRKGCCKHHHGTWRAEIDPDTLARIPAPRVIPEEFAEMFLAVQRKVTSWAPSMEVEDTPTIDLNPVFGIVHEIKEIDLENGYGSHILVILDSPEICPLTGTQDFRGIHCFHTILEREVGKRLERHHLNPGDLMSVHYQGLGKDRGNGRSPAKMYRVEVRRGPNSTPYADLVTGEITNVQAKELLVGTDGQSSLEEPF